MEIKVKKENGPSALGWSLEWNPENSLDYEMFALFDRYRPDDKKDSEYGYLRVTDSFAKYLRGEAKHGKDYVLRYDEMTELDDSLVSNLFGFNPFSLIPE